MADALHDLLCVLLGAWFVWRWGWWQVFWFAVVVVILKLGELIWPGTAFWLGQQSRAALVWAGLL